MWQTDVETSLFFLWAKETQVLLASDLRRPMSLFIEVHSVKVHVTDSVRLFSSELLNLIACCSLTGVPIVLYLCILSHFLPRSDSLSSPPFFVDRLCSPPSVSLVSFDLLKFKPIVQEEIKKMWNNPAFQAHPFHWNQHEMAEQKGWAVKRRWWKPPFSSADIRLSYPDNGITAALKDSLPHSLPGELSAVKDKLHFCLLRVGPLHYHTAHFPPFGLVVNECTLSVFNVYER